ncbi:MAG: TetR/AcrR family transcriptional regulator [Marmoricola sp.]
MPPRAAPLAPDERRAALVEAALPLLREHGRTVTTRQIAEAAGVAEGTIFRVFDSKDDLVLAALERGMDIEPFLDDLAAIDATLPLRPRLLELVRRLQHRFEGVFALMTAMGMVGPPRSHRHTADGRQRADALMVALVEPDADRLRCTPAELVHVLRLLTFSGTHPHLSDGRLLSPEHIVSLVLDGALRPGKES